MSEPIDHPRQAARLRNVGLVVGVLGTAGSVVGALVDYPAFIHAYVFAFVYWAALPVGGLMLLAMQHLVRSRSLALLRRPLEAVGLTAILLAAFFVPIALSMPQVYRWTIPQVVAHSAELQHKQVYLNVPFFLVRAGVFIAAWSVVAVLFRRWSLREDDLDGRRTLSKRFRAAAAGAAVVLILTDTFAIIDWVESLEPQWYSSIYPWMLIVGQLLTCLVFCTLLTVYLSRARSMTELVDADRLNDLGNLLLAFVGLWGYFNFMQFIIEWSGDLHEHIPWYLARSNGGWQWVIAAIGALQLGVPLLVLFFRKVKRSGRLLGALCVGLLLMRALNVYWLVIPAFSPGAFWLSWQAVATWAAVGGWWLAGFGWWLGRAPLVARATRLLFETESRQPKGGQQ